MKKLLIALCLLLTIISCAIAKEREYDPGEYTITSIEFPNPRKCGNYEYVILKYGAAEIVQANFLKGDITLPSELEGYRVASIGKDIFYYMQPGHTTASNSSIPDSITIPKSVTHISNNAFSGCSALTSITIPDSVTYIGDSAFSGCRSIGNIIIPDSVAHLGVGAFGGCVSLTNIVLPANIHSIEDGTFSGCQSLTRISLPTGITQIGQSAFRGCSALTSITLPASVTHIGYNAFSDCSSLASIVIPTSVTSIEAKICQGSPNAVLVVTPGSYAEKYAINNKLSYTYAVPDSSWTCVCGNTNSFNYCVKCGAQRNDAVASDEENEIPGLASGSFDYVLLDNGTAMITGYTGSDIELTIPTHLDGIPVTAIQHAAIASETLTRVCIPDTVVNVTSTPFFLCPKLTSIEVSLEHPTLATIDGVLFYKPTKKLIAYPQGLTDTSYAVPQKIEIIGESAFQQGINLVDITLPDSIRRIESSAFDCCSSILSINLPEGLTDIADSAFLGCSALTSVAIPDSAVNIDGNPFVLCSKLENIRVSLEHPTLAVIDGALFDKTSKTLIVYPAGCVAERYEIPQGIKKIGHHAFSYNKLQTIVIPASVTEIEDYAFSLSKNLTSITIPATVTTIGSDLFINCPNVSVTLTRNSPLVPELKESGIAYTYSDLYDWLN